MSNLLGVRKRCLTGALIENNNFQLDCFASEPIHIENNSAHEGAELFYPDAENN